MKKHFNCKLLYSDRDSFVYEIKSTDFYAKLRRKSVLKDLFDFSNLPSYHELHDRGNARVTLKFNDEMGGKLISEFLGLKPKLYSIELADGEYTFNFFFGNQKRLIPIRCKLAEQDW